jgi:Cd2+/Zn2+-exporting ATPase
VADAVRPEAVRVLAELRGAGVQRLIMLTGDNRGTAAAVARELGLDDFRAELLPEEKVGVVRELEAQHGGVAMIGDGINDAPALAAATIGIAMGAAGSDVAIETADIALMSDDLTRVPWLIRHSRRTLRVIQQNIAFALGLKLVFIVLAFAGVATLWMAIAADMGASLLVIANALRLLKD